LHEEFLTKARGKPMIYEFDAFEIDTDKVELRGHGRVLPIEPRPYALLLLLVENRERLVTKDEIIEKIWDGRFISEAAISTAVRTLRQVLEDDGSAQKYVRTVRGRGFRFVAPVRLRSPASATVEMPAGSRPPSGPELIGRPVIAVTPFRLLGSADATPAIAEAVPAELISSLSRLRWLSVIARGSSFRFRGSNIDLDAVRETLGARYCLSGTIEIVGQRMTLGVELSRTSDHRVVWAEHYSCRIHDVQEIRMSIAQSVVTALELHVPLSEAMQARGQHVDDLDAWSLYHLGLQHMYRFNKADNMAAAQLFQSALERDPYLARAHAGLSFTRFQDAFLRYGQDPAADRLAARRHAERSLELDPVDPIGNFNLGRALWLEGAPDAGLPWLDQATQLNPNYAQGFYARAWTDIIADRAAEGRRHVDAAMQLSPIDPLLYAMLATRAVTHLIEGNTTEAARWADRAARAPGAHFLIALIAIAALDADGQVDRAQAWAADVKARRSDVTLEHFLRAFPFEGGTTRDLFSTALRRYGF
jgi:TolB-like protein